MGAGKSQIKAPADMVSDMVSDVDLLPGSYTAVSGWVLTCQKGECSAGLSLVRALLPFISLLSF